MEFLIVIISVLFITVVFWLARKYSSIKICPICSGVFLTWLWLFIGMKLNLLFTADYQLITAILMGGTVVGAMSKLEQFIKPNLLLFWKTIFVIFGFLAFYGLLLNKYLIFGIGVIFAIVITFIFKIRKEEAENRKLKNTEFEDKMKNCC